MIDYNSIYGPGDYQNGETTVVVEIPEGSRHKIEYNRELKTFELDRVEPAIFTKPCNYGFIPATLDEDGDELDVLLVAGESLPLGVVVHARIIGVLNFEDDGEMDHKVICVVSDDRDANAHIKSVDDLGEQWKQKVEYHFNHYKDLRKPGSTEVQGFGNIEHAKTIIGECVKRWEQQ